MDAGKALLCTEMLYKLLYAAVSLNKDTGTYTPTYCNANFNYRDPRKGSPDFGKAPYE